MEILKRLCCNYRQKYRHVKNSSYVEMLNVGEFWGHYT